MAYGMRKTTCVSWIAFSIFAGFVLLTIVLTHGVVNDDTYITMRYARNVSEHGQFTYNIGHPTYSLTTPAWAILVGCLGWTHIDYILLGQMVSMGVASIAGLYLYRLTKHLAGEGIALFAWILLFLDPYLIGAVYCGTEMALFASLSVALIYYLVAYRESLRINLVLASLISLMIWTRPEGAVVSLIASVHMLSKHGWGHGVRRVALIMLTSVVLLAPWLIYAALTFKTIIPTSVILKSIDAGGRALFADPITITRLLLLVVKGYLPHIAIVCFGGALLLIHRKGRMAWRGLIGSIASGRALPILLTVSLLLFYLMGLKEKAVSSRYLVTFSPFLTLATVQSLVVIRNKVPAWSGKMRPLCACVVAMLLLINIGAVISRAERSKSERSAVEAGKWIASHIDPASVVASIGNAGAVAYLFQGTVWDFDLISQMGADIDFAKRRRRREDIPVEAYLYKNPDYFITVRAIEEFNCLGSIIYQNDGLQVIQVAR